MSGVPFSFFTLPIFTGDTLFTAELGGGGGVARVDGTAIEHLLRLRPGPAQQHLGPTSARQQLQGCNISAGAGTC